MKRIFFCALVIFIIGFANAVPLSAQGSGAKITITRPGEGETLYSSPASTFAAVPVTGFVSTENFDVKQLQVRLDLYDGAKITGSLTTTPSADGTFSFDVGINSNAVSDLNESEQGCDARCHMEKPFIFPTGHVIFRVSVIDPFGHKATAERSITVDVSGYVDVPVQVVIDGEPGRAIEGITVVADTRLYLWRARQYSAKTDTNGRAVIRLERLAQAPTHYVIQIEPRVVNGAMTISRVPIQVTLPPGVMQVAPVTLVAQLQRGQIQGTIANFQNRSDLTVRASSFSSGAAYSAKTNQGKFVLSNLPLDKYLVAVDDTDVINQGIHIEPQTIDLSTNPVMTTTLKLATDSARIVRGIVHDNQGNPLPFAWLANDQKDKTARVAPSSGKFILSGLASDDHALWVSAPGYWSQPVAVADRLDIALTPRPDTRIIPWGFGNIILPSQTLADVSGNQISIKRGWVWGKGSNAFNIHTPELDIAMQTGTFALEFLPGETNWFYLIDGQAQVNVLNDGKTIMMNANQMLASGKGVSIPSSIALDDAAIRALHSNEPSQVPVETDPTITARLHDEIEQRGIPFTRAALTGVLCIVILLFGMVWQIRWRRRQLP